MLKTQTPFIKWTVIFLAILAISGCRHASRPYYDYGYAHPPRERERPVVVVRPVVVPTFQIDRHHHERRHDYQRWWQKKPEWNRRDRRGPD